MQSLGHEICASVVPVVNACVWIALFGCSCGGCGMLCWVYQSRLFAVYGVSHSDSWYLCSDNFVVAFDRDLRERWCFNSENPFIVSTMGNRT